MDATRTIAWVDWAVVAVYFGAVIFIGTWFARRQKTTEEYFMGGRSVPGWAVGISLFAGAISTATFIAYPERGYGGDWKLLLPGLTLPFVALYVTLIIIPFYRRAVTTSAYEYLESRFGYGARAYAGFCFIMYNLFRMGFILFLVSKALHTMTGWDIRAIMILSGAIAILYTVIGGVEAVIWTDVLQAAVLFGGGLVCVYMLLYTPQGGPTQMIDIAMQANKFKLAELSLDLTKPTILVTICYGVFLYADLFSSQQWCVQRYLSVRSTREAQTAIWMGNISCVLTWVMFMLVGTLLYSYTQLNPTWMPPHIASDNTKVFPYFILSQLPTGMVGLVLAALCAAGISSLDTAINSTAMVSVYDFYGRLRPAVSDQHRLKLAKIMSFVWGIVGICIGLAMIPVKDALEFSFKALSLLGGGLFGMFLLAFFVRRAHPIGAYVGLVGGILITASGIMNEIIKVGALPESFQRFAFPLDPLLVGTCAHATSFTLGLIVSLLIPRHLKCQKGLTIWDECEKPSPATTRANQLV